ncbi:MAG: hypothetical protein AABZ33_08945 [Chloroflexota bacterium]
MDVIQLWWLTLGIAAVVILVVAALLLWIARAAERIDAHALDIWRAGKSIAANTVQIWHLHKTNEVAGKILAGAQTIAGVALSIDDRLERLPAALKGDGA